MSSPEQSAARATPSPGPPASAGPTTLRDMQLLSSFNHDARTPLSAILGAFQLLSRSDISPGQRNLAEAGRRAVMQLLHCLDNFVEFNRSRAGVVDPAPGTELLEAFSITWAQNLRETIDTYGKDLQSQVSLAPGLPETIETDAHYLNLVMSNLFDNAARYTESGRIAVRIEPVDGARIAFDVTDTGPGIPAEQRDTLFVSRSGGPELRRVAIGLPLAAAVARLLGGTLHLRHSGPDGSTFRLSLPAEAAGDISEPSAA